MKRITFSHSRSKMLRPCPPIPFRELFHQTFFVCRSRAFFIWPLTSQCVILVNDHDDPAFKRNCIAFPVLLVSCAVPAFMMVKAMDCAISRWGVMNPTISFPRCRMGFYTSNSSIVSGPFLKQYVVRYSQFANIMQRLAGYFSDTASGISRADATI